MNIFTEGAKMSHLLHHTNGVEETELSGTNYMEIFKVRLPNSTTITHAAANMTKKSAR